jgi:hypothetical protein
MPPIIYDSRLAGKAAGFHSTRFYDLWLRTGDGRYHSSANAFYAIFEDLYVDAIESAHVRRAA